jgi:2,5-diamino-6-(ribosylamino)-4(3H)-pyrimidinone 5'-phosphate reductase
MSIEKKERPYIILSAAMTIDGKIASRSGDPELSNEEDWKEVHKLRTKVDAIMVGKGTILNDNPKLHIKYYEHHGYQRIVMDSNLMIPINSKVLTYKKTLYPTIICCLETINGSKEQVFKEMGVTIIKAGKGGKVDIRKALEILFEKGVRRILLEGGGTLNWSFLEEDLIDEIRLTIAPWMVGGLHATSLVQGKGFKKMKESPRFNLINVIHNNNYITLHYKRKRLK